MRHSNTHLRSLLLCGCGCFIPLHADDLTLAGGTSHLTGTVRSINGTGLVELASPLSPEPLLLKGGMVDKVEFSNTDAAQEPPSALIELANGDTLAVSLDGLDAQALTVTSPEAGRLQIPRAALSSAQLGIRRIKTIYSGPKRLDEWADGEADTKNWEFKDGGLIASGPATASKDIGLPQQFILRFTLTWEEKKAPNFQVHFADPLRAKGELCDRYYLQFGGAGLEMKREAATGKRYNTIIQLNRTPNQYPDHRIQVEIRVDRIGARIQLFINGEPEGEIADPITPIPDGSGITLTSNTSNGNSQEIRDIEVLEFDDSRVRHHAEERGNPENDSLISREDDRWGGRLIDIHRAGGESVFRFKSDFQEAPLEIPEADVSTIFFAARDRVKPDDRQPPFVLKLRGNGSIQVESCHFTEDTVTAAHPLLGPLTLRRDGILSMERTIPKPEPAPEP